MVLLSKGILLGAIACLCRDGTAKPMPMDHHLGGNYGHFAHDSMAPSYHGHDYPSSLLNADAYYSAQHNLDQQNYGTSSAEPYPAYQGDTQAGIYDPGRQGTSYGTTDDLYGAYSLGYAYPSMDSPPPWNEFGHIPSMDLDWQQGSQGRNSETQAHHHHEVQHSAIYPAYSGNTGIHQSQQHQHHQHHQYQYQDNQQQEGSLGHMVHSNQGYGALSYPTSPGRLFPLHAPEDYQEHVSQQAHAPDLTQYLDQMSLVQAGNDHNVHHSRPSQTRPEPHRGAHGYVFKLKPYDISESDVYTLKHLPSNKLCFTLLDDDSKQRVCEVVQARRPQLYRTIRRRVSSRLTVKQAINLLTGSEQQIADAINTLYTYHNYGTHAWIDDVNLDEAEIIVDRIGFATRLNRVKTRDLLLRREFTKEQCHETLTGSDEEVRAIAASLTAGDMEEAAED